MSAAPWIASYDLARRGLEKTLDGISDAEALIVVPSGSNSINWLVGHILVYRDRIHAVLGLRRAWPERLGSSEPYRSGSFPSGAEPVVPLSELRAELHRSQDAVLVKLTDLRPADLATAASPTRTLGEQLALFGAHDFYHLGQIGMIRRLLGKPGALG